MTIAMLGKCSSKDALKHVGHSWAWTNILGAMRRRTQVRAYQQHAGPIKAVIAPANVASCSPGKTRAEKNGFSAARSFVSAVANCS